MNQPSKEKVERWKTESGGLSQTTTKQNARFINLCDAYLALLNEKEQQQTKEVL